MKNKLLLSIALCATMLTSCDMDLAPIGSIDDKKALESVNDAIGFRTGMYVGFRSFTSSRFFSYSDIQADMFNGLITNGNNLGTIANGVVLSSDGDIAGYWASCFGLIANINYFLENIQPLYDKAVEDNEEDDVVMYKLIIGEARFFRGYYYAEMFDRWCTVYSPEKGDQPGLGLPIVTHYAPSADRGSYPGRSTMNETLSFIKADIQAGLDALLEYEELDDSNLEPMAIYLSSYAVKAMQARLALWTGDYQAALNLSKEIIDTNIYPLCTLKNYPDMWTKDTGTEIIMLPYEDTDELGNAIGDTWIKKDTEQAWYIPASTAIDAYAAAGGTLLGMNDVRYACFIQDRNLKAFGVTVTTPCFSKFPGNPALDTSSSQVLYNKPKPFRTSELYMIAAESAAMLGQNELANKYLNDFCLQRIKRYKEQTLSGQELVNAIREQRTLEFIGEGFRISDLRRWKMGFSRAAGGKYAATPDVEMILTTTGLNVSYTQDDHRYTWPIPSDEIQSNPQMTGQQNPGY